MIILLTSLINSEQFIFNKRIPMYVLHANSISFSNHNQTWLLINQNNEIEIKFSIFFYVYDTHECFICLNFKLIKADLNGVSDFSVFKKGFCGFLNG